MKILEAWARGVPVVATPEAAQASASKMVRAFSWLATERNSVRLFSAFTSSQCCANNLIEAGRKNLNDRHSPSRVTDMLEETYLDVIREQPVPI